MTPKELETRVLGIGGVDDVELNIMGEGRDKIVVVPSITENYFKCDDPFDKVEHEIKQIVPLGISVTVMDLDDRS
jgi:hypothetical protein